MESPPNKPEAKQTVSQPFKSPFSQTTKGRLVSPRLSLPSSQKVAAISPSPRTSPLPDIPTRPLSIKEIMLASSRPVASIKSAILDLHSASDSRTDLDVSGLRDTSKRKGVGPTVFTLPSHRVVRRPVPSQDAPRVKEPLLPRPPGLKPPTLNLPGRTMPPRTEKPEPPRISQEVPSAPISQSLASVQASAVVPRSLTGQSAGQASSPPAQGAQTAQSSQKDQASQNESAKPARRRLWRRRVPEKRQTSATECGAACLAMVLHYYGRVTSISEVQELCGAGRDGLSARVIVKTARQYGLRVRAVSVKAEDFRYVNLPAIVHWEFNHFVIVERWTAKYVELVDPAIGRRRVTHEEFSDAFTGVVIMLEPGGQFERRTTRRSLTLWTYTRSLLRMRGVVTQILASSLFLQLIGLGMPLLTALIVDTIIPSGNRDLLQMLGLGVILLLVSQGVTKLLRASLLIYLQTRIDTQMMLDFFEHMLSLPYRFFQTRLTGDLLSRVSSNTAIRDLLTGQLISAVLDSSTVLIYFAVLLWLSPLIAGITLIVGAFQMALLLLTAPAVRRLTQRDLVVQGKAQGYLNEALAGIATIKAAGAENQTFDRWTNLFFEQMNVSIRRNYLLAVISVIFEFLHTTSPLLLLWLGAVQVMSGTMPLGVMLALNTLAAAFLAPLSSLTASGQKVQIAQAHFERIADIFEAEPEQDPRSVSIPPKLSGNIELADVSFQYAPNTPMILQEINVKIRPGQKVALVGKTGSGKSTLGKLLIGLITPTKGHIFFDDLPLHMLNFREVRRQFGVVLQEAFIFSGSVRDNIAFHNPEMSLERVAAAARAAAIHEDVEKMPMGYETLVSEGGSAFSGGQRQRLALARALAHQPSILLLDEATSALDVATERAVEQNLHRFSCTQIVIAHRLSTIRNADLILVLDQGRIIEQGSHELLLRRKGFYSRLIQMQLANGEIEAA
jgi:ATP-binding cassette subfamily B protein